MLIARIAQREDAAELLAPHSEREEKVLLRKVDWIMMTLLQFALSESLDSGYDGETG
jgi:hypothetical protein